jgi:Nucleotidyltransferase of unknown function (DUF6036)
MPVQSKDLWSLARNRQCVDPQELAAAIEDQIARGDLDFRSRLLIRDSMDALDQYWGKERLTAWLATCPVRAEVEAIWDDDLGEVGFSFLARHVMEPTRPGKIKQFFRSLGEHLHRPVHMVVGGAVALILSGHLLRRTEGVDVVDYVPAEFRQNKALGDELANRYRLYLAHFQSQYLPQDWEQRVHPLEPFEQLQVAIVDPYDIFLSKLYSSRNKDKDDLRFLAWELEKDTLARRLQDFPRPWRVEAALQAINNWYILYGEALPS